MSHDFCHLHQIKRLMLSSEDFGGTIHKSNGSDLTTSTLSHSQYRPSIARAIKAGLPRASSITEAGVSHHVTTWQTTGAGCCRYPPQPVRTRTSVDTHAHTHTRLYSLLPCPLHSLPDRSNYTQPYMNLKPGASQTLSLSHKQPVSAA